MEKAMQGKSKPLFEENWYKEYGKGHREDKLENESYEKKELVYLWKKSGFSVFGG